MAYVAADDALRETAREWDERLDKYMVGLGFSEDLYRAVREFAATPEAAALTGEDARLLERTLRDYRRNGFERPADDRQELRALFDELVELGTQFRQAIDDWDDGIDVTREELDGLPESFIDGLRRVEAALPRLARLPGAPAVHGQRASARCAASCSRRTSARAAPENVAAARSARSRCAHEIATAARLRLLGRLRASNRAWRSAARPSPTFLDDLRDQVAIKAAADMAAARRRERSRTRQPRRQHLGLALLPQRADEDDVRGRRLRGREVLPARCLPRRPLRRHADACSACSSAEAPDAPRWHPDVRAFDITRGRRRRALRALLHGPLPAAEQVRPRGRLHASSRGRRLPDGTLPARRSARSSRTSRSRPPTQPSLLRHREVETSLPRVRPHPAPDADAGRSARDSAGRATERDFVEAPSQMLEHWCWEPDGAVVGFARHYETGEPLPEELLDSHDRREERELRHHDAAPAVLRDARPRLPLARLRRRHDGDPAKRCTTSPASRTPEGTHFQAGFGHLFGYDAGYYGYLWSQVFGDDMYTKFEAARPDGHRNRRLHYRRTILERGGTVDGDQLVRDFLGREPNNEAFLRGLGLENLAFETRTPRPGLRTCACRGATAQRADSFPCPGRRRPRSRMRSGSPGQTC